MSTPDPETTARLSVSEAIEHVKAERDSLRECCRTWEDMYTSLFAGMNALGQKKMVPSADRMPPPTQMCIWFGWKGETKTWRLGALSRLQVEEEGLTHWMPLPDPPPSAGNVATPETTPREEWAPGIPAGCYHFRDEDFDAAEMIKQLVREAEERVTQENQES